MSDPTQVATFGGGCFWCLDEVFRQMRGVRHVTSGYAGGKTRNPSYREVCGGETGHAEVVQVEFDPGEISYADLLDVFFTVHDPTTPDRQGADRGTQYRSIILHHDDGQRETAERVIAELGERGVWDDPIVTQIVPATDFWRAEESHQEYFRRNPTQPYCQIVIAPKVAKLRRVHLERLRA